MLLVANGAVGSVPSAFGELLLLLGGTLGVLAIPLYFVGYQAAIGLLQLAGPRHRLARLGAGFAAVFGALTHGLTALDIRSARLAGRGLRPPAEAFADTSGPLFIAALLAAAGAIAAAACMLTGPRRREPRLDAAVILNPVLLTLLLGIVAAFSEPTMAYLAPSAPNLAHLLFFVLLARAARLAPAGA